MFQQRGEIEDKYLLRNIPYLFVRNSKRVFDYLKEKSDKKYRNRNSITNYEIQLNIVCRPHINALNIDKELFCMSFILCRILYLLSLVSYCPQILES